MLKLFFGAIGVVVQIVIIAIAFIVFSATLAVMLMVIRAASREAKKPLNQLVSDCLAFPSPITLMRLVKWAMRLSLVLAPAICIKLFSAAITRAIEVFVSMMDNPKTSES